jgi:hypothetical protein
MRTQEYRSKAAACLLAAENAKSSEGRMRWLAMAQAWFKLAESADLMDLAESDDATDHDEAYFQKLTIHHQAN